MKESYIAIVIILALVSVLLKTKENSFICNRQTEQCEEDPNNNRGYDTLEECITGARQCRQEWTCALPGREGRPGQCIRERPRRGFGRPYFNNEFNCLRQCRETDNPTQKYGCHRETGCYISTSNNPNAIYDTMEECHASCPATDPILKYKCEGGRCIRALDGTFNNPQECQASGCGNTGFSCEAGRCEEVRDQNDIPFPNLNSCLQDGCQGSDNRFICNNQVCTGTPRFENQIPGPSFATERECHESACEGAIGSYECVDQADGTSRCTPDPVPFGENGAGPFETLDDCLGQGGDAGIASPGCEGLSYICAHPNGDDQPGVVIAVPGGVDRQQADEPQRYATADSPFLRYCGDEGYYCNNGSCDYFVDTSHAQEFKIGFDGITNLPEALERCRNHGCESHYTCSAAQDADGNDIEPGTCTEVQTPYDPSDLTQSRNLEVCQSTLTGIGRNCGVSYVACENPDGSGDRCVNKFNVYRPPIGIDGHGFDELATCLTDGCEGTSFICSRDGKTADQGGDIVEVNGGVDRQQDGEPQRYATEQELTELGCGNTGFRCNAGSCERVVDIPESGSEPAGYVGPVIEFADETECIGDGGAGSCEGSSIACSNDAGDGSGNCVEQPGAASRPGRFATEAACLTDQSCEGTSFRCEQGAGGDQCTEVDGNAARGADRFPTQGECDAVCIGDSYDCADQGDGTSRCTVNPIPFGQPGAGAYRTEVECIGNGDGNSCEGSSVACSNNAGDGSGSCETQPGGAYRPGRFVDEATCLGTVATPGTCEGTSFLCDHVGNSCSEVIGNTSRDGDRFDTQAGCEAVCTGESYDCNGGVCTANPISFGRPGGGTFATLGTCLENGCEGTSFICSREGRADDEGGVPSAVPGGVDRQPPGGPTRYPTAVAATAAGCGNTGFNCDGGTCTFEVDVPTTFADEQECLGDGGAGSCEGSSIACSNDAANGSGNCVSQPGAASRPGRFADEATCLGSLADPGTCEGTSFRCEQDAQGNDQCTEVIGNAGRGADRFSTQGECDSACSGDSFECSNNAQDGSGTCISNPIPFGQPGAGPFNTLQECLADAVCEAPSFICSRDGRADDEGGVPTSVPGAVDRNPGGPTRYVDAAAATAAGCGNTGFNCDVGTCTFEVDVPTTFADEQTCLDDGCEGNSWTCSNDAADGSGNCVQQPGAASRPGRFATEAACLGTVGAPGTCEGTSFECNDADDSCAEVIGNPSRPPSVAGRTKYRDQATCESACAGESYDCVGGVCTLNPIPFGRAGGGEFQDLPSCLADGCEGSSFICSREGRSASQGGVVTEVDGGVNRRPQGAPQRYPTAQAALDAGCGNTGYNCDGTQPSGSRCTFTVDTLTDYATAQDCRDNGCETSYICNSPQADRPGQCQSTTVQYTGQADRFPNQTDCESSGCGKDGYECNAQTCTYTKDSNGITYENGVPIINGLANWAAGLQNAENACEFAGCEGLTTFNCVENADGSRTCTEVVGGGGSYATRQECEDAGCEGSWTCAGAAPDSPGTCTATDVPYTGQPDRHANQADCEASGCGNDGWDCLPLGAGGTACFQNANQPTNAFNDQAECWASGCEGYTWTCDRSGRGPNQGGVVSRVDIPSGEPGAGEFATEADAIASGCGNTGFFCDTSIPNRDDRCTRINDVPLQGSEPAGYQGNVIEYTNEADCNAGGCEDRHWQCTPDPGGGPSTCQEYDGAAQAGQNPPQFSSESICQISGCGNSGWTCNTDVANLADRCETIQDVPIDGSQPDGYQGPLIEYSTEQECESNCEVSSWKCVNPGNAGTPNGGCELVTGPDSFINGYPTKDECDAATFCNTKGYNCVTSPDGSSSSCVLTQNEEVEFPMDSCDSDATCNTELRNAREECNNSGCDDVSFICDRTGRAANQGGQITQVAGPVSLDPDNRYATAGEAAASGCGNVGFSCSRGSDGAPTPGACVLQVDIPDDQISYLVGSSDLIPDTNAALTLCRDSGCERYRNWSCNPEPPAGFVDGQTDRCVAVFYDDGMNPPANTYTDRSQCDSNCFFGCMDPSAAVGQKCERRGGQNPGPFRSKQECETDCEGYGYGCRGSGQAGTGFVCRQRPNYMDNQPNNEQYPTLQDCTNDCVYKYEHDPTNNQAGTCVPSSRQVCDREEPDGYKCFTTDDGSRGDGLTARQFCELETARGRNYIWGYGCYADDAAGESGVRIMPNSDDYYGRTDDKSVSDTRWATPDEAQTNCTWACDSQSQICSYDNTDGEFAYNEKPVCNTRCQNYCEASGLTPEQLCGPGGTCSPIDGIDNQGHIYNCECAPGYNKDPTTADANHDGSCVAMPACNPGEFIYQGADGVSFCTPCRSCSHWTTKAVDCSGTGFEDTTRCVPTDLYCGNPNDRRCTWGNDADSRGRTGSQNQDGSDAEYADIIACNRNTNGVCGTRTGFESSNGVGDDLAGPAKCGPTWNRGGTNSNQDDQYGSGTVDGNIGGHWGYTSQGVNSYFRLWPLSNQEKNHCRFNPSQVQYLP